MLPKIKIVLPLLSDATQVKYNAGGVAMQDSAAQHWTSTILGRWYFQIFLVKMVVGILIIQTQKIDDCR